MRPRLPSLSFFITFLIIEFLDELIFGAREAAWPLIRNDLDLNYYQVGLLLSAPHVVGNLVEPFLGILGDVWRRRVLILGGGIVYILALLLTAISHDFLFLLFAFVMFYPASGAFVSLSQAELMDSDPERHEQNMARWTFVGSLGIVVGSLIFGAVTSIGLSWRSLFLIFAILTVVPLYAYGTQTIVKSERSHLIPAESSDLRNDFRTGIGNAINALRRKDVLRWLVLLEFADLTLDIFQGFLALYFVDVAGIEPNQAGLAVAIWTGFGFLGDLLLIQLLERVDGLRYLRISGLIVLCVFPIFLLVPNLEWKLVLIGALGLLNAGWYAIPKGRLYSAMPRQSGTVMALGNIFHLLGSLFPLGIGLVAQKYSLQNAMWLILLGPIMVLIGIPRGLGKTQDVPN